MIYLGINKLLTSDFHLSHFGYKSFPIDEIDIYTPINFFKKHFLPNFNNKHNEICIIEFDNNCNITNVVYLTGQNTFYNSNIGINISDLSSLNAFIENNKYLSIILDPEKSTLFLEGLYELYKYDDANKLYQIFNLNYQFDESYDTNNSLDTPAFIFEKYIYSSYYQYKCKFSHIIIGNFTVDYAIEKYEEFEYQRYFNCFTHRQLAIYFLKHNPGYTVVWDYDTWYAIGFTNYDIDSLFIIDHVSKIIYVNAEVFPEIDEELIEIIRKILIIKVKNTDFDYFITNTITKNIINKYS